MPPGVEPAVTNRAERYRPLSPEVAERWANYGKWDEPYFPRLVGLQVEELRQDYCRMRLPWRREITQPAGVAHGGAIAALVDSVVVPAIGSHYEQRRAFVTIDLHLQFLGALVDEDAVAEGWVTQRGRSIVFCEAEVVGATSGRAVARGALAYKVSSRVLE
jgi:uncharacterized protein (TIGR00369 family)